jgi:hypothetical protein
MSVYSSLADPRIVIEFFNSALHCRARNVILDSEESQTLRNALGPSVQGPFRIELNEDQESVLDTLITAKQNFITKKEEPWDYCVARSFGKADLLSYDIHADRELSMMLSGEKPMAFFTVEEGFAFGDLCEQPFEQFVADGTIVQSTFLLRTSSQAAVTYVVFTLPREVWRFFSLRFLKTAKVRWDKTLERLEGLLLGYSDEQCDEYLALFWPDEATPLQAPRITR